PQTLEQEMLEINDLLEQPLDEINLIYTSVRDREYVYKCTQAPIFQFCDKATCKLREYGVGGENLKDGSLFTDIEFGDLTQYRYIKDAPNYEWKIRIQGQEN